MKFKASANFAPLLFPKDRIGVWTSPSSSCVRQKDMGHDPIRERVVKLDRCQNSLARFKLYVWSFVLTWALASGLEPNAFAEVKLPGLFSDNMVLQQNASVPVWGWADDGEAVTVLFRGKKATTTAQNGKWMVRIGSFKAGGPEQMLISGKNT